MMTIIAQSRLSKIKPSATIAISTLAASMKEEGKNVISLGMGEPDFDTPDNIKEAAFKAIKDGHTTYTAVAGITPLRKAIIDKLKRDNNLEYNMEQILVSTGAKQSIYNALMASIEEGDEVVIPSPFWVSYPDMVALAGGNPVIVPCDDKSDFKIDPSDLEKAITDKTKWLILNSPSNPTGMLYTKEELSEIAKILVKYPNIWVMTDDMYEHLVFDKKKFHNIAAIEPKLYDRTLTINGVSKAYAMTGWRIGYAAGDKDLIKAMNKVQSQSTSSTCSISQHAAIEAISGPQDKVFQMRDEFEKRRNKVVELLNAIDGINCLTPDGAFYVYPNCSGLIGKKTPEGKIIENDNELSQYLLKEQGVAVVPGEAFGLSPHFRISYAASVESLIDACDRIKKACDNLK
jgi:aspartate aminotransferase